jgi:hypothetical protein
MIFTFKSLQIDYLEAFFIALFALNHTRFFDKIFEIKYYNNKTSKKHKS